MNQADAVNIIKECCDDIAPYWKEHIEFWEDEEDRGYYNDMAVLAQYVVEQYSNGNTKDFKKIFNACEDIYKSGSDEGIEAISLGFIETLLFISSHEPFGTQAIEPWMEHLTLEDYVEYRDAFEKMATERWESYSPIKKLYLKVKNKLKW